MALIEAAARNFRAMPENLREPAIIAGLFLAGAIAYYFYWEFSRGTGKPGFRRALTYIFPRDLYAHRSSRSDIGNFALTYLLWFPLMRTAVSAVATILSVGAVYSMLADQFGAPDAATASVAVLVFQTLVLFLGAEFGAYAGHWMLHRVPLLWSIHRAHHSAETLTIFTRLRQHPLDLLWSAFARVGVGSIASAVVLFLAGTPVSPPAIKAYLAISFFIPFTFDVWRHCHMPITLGPLNRIFNAPVMHQIHHSAEPRHFDKNLGAELTIFDWLFGTLYLPERDEQYRWGLNERELRAGNPHNRLRDFYLEPFRYARARLSGRLAHPAGKAVEGDAA